MSNRKDSVYVRPSSLNPNTNNNLKNSIRTIEISDKDYQNLVAFAKAEGRTPEQLIHFFINSAISTYMTFDDEFLNNLK